jgi:hypothetical protein
MAITGDFLVATDTRSVAMASKIAEGVIQILLGPVPLPRGLANPKEFHMQLTSSTCASIWTRTESIGN